MFDNQDDYDRKKEEFVKIIREMRAVADMIRNAPRDHKDNVVVSVVSIKNFGLFYLFEN